MFRTMIVPLEWLATFFAIASPLVILHWLFGALDASSLKGFVEFFNPFIDPFNQTLEVILKPIPAFDIPWIKINTSPFGVMPTMVKFSLTSPIQVMNHQVSPVQGVLGMLLTVLFFCMNVVIQLMKAGEKKIEVAANTRRMDQALKESRLAKVAHSKKLLSNKDILVYVDFGFLECPTGATYFETGFSRFGGASLQSNPDCLIVQFKNVNEALQYVQATTMLLAQYYEKLHPSEPRPPFKICVAAFAATTGNPDKFEFCRTLKNYAGLNQTILTDESKLILEANDKMAGFKIETMGYYNVSGKNTEIHVLKG